MAYSSKGNHTGQLEYYNWLEDSISIMFRQYY
jgi:hypothetical protein